MNRILSAIAAVSAFWAADAGHARAQIVQPPGATSDETCVTSRRVRCPSAAEILAAANDRARRAPDANAFVRARQIYPYESGGLYRLYASPTYVSMILLEPGEAVTAIAAGDTSRWMVTEAEAEAERAPRAIILVKPNSANLNTNIAIITDRRTYLVEAQSVAGDRYSAEIAWTYADAVASAPRPLLDTINTAYRVRAVRGARPAWSPVSVSDDGRRTWIEFPPGIDAGDLPPLFVITPEGAELVNYRVDGARYVVDRVFDAAELRLGVRAPIIVRIERNGAERASQRRRRRP